jgi:integrase
MALRTLDTWCKDAGIQKHITWQSARLSFSILLQDANVDDATMALLLGHQSTQYVQKTYKRFRPKDQTSAIAKLPSPFPTVPIQSP